MQGVNSLFFQPISIHKPYLFSLVPEIVAGYRNNSFANIDNLKKNATSALEMQAERAQETGADTFPIILNIVGPIIKHSNWSYLGTQFYTNLIKNLDSNVRVSHIILNIDSGGGMVSGTKELTETIRNCSTPTISFTNGLACSAAQQIHSAADVAVASPYADLLGSIGTLISYQDFSAMFEKWGAKIYEAYAPQSTEKNKAFRDWEAGDSEAIETDLRKHADDFISIMKTYRGDKLVDDGKLFKGATYSPEEALKVGLIDEIMTLEELINNL